MRPSRSRVIVAALVLLALLPGTAGQAMPDDLTQQLDRARAELAERDTQVSLAVEDVNAVTAQLDRLQSQQQQTAARVDALRSEVAAIEELTTAFVRQMYMRGPTTREAEAPDTGANVRIREDGLLRSHIVGYGRP